MQCRRQSQAAPPTAARARALTHARPGCALSVARSALRAQIFAFYVLKPWLMVLIRESQRVTSLLARLPREVRAGARRMRVGVRACLRVLVYARGKKRECKYARVCDVCMRACVRE